MKMQKMAVAVILGFVLGISAVSAQGFFTGYFTFDEIGYGIFQTTPIAAPTIIPNTVVADPTGRSSVPVLVYQLPFLSATPGDLWVRESEDLNTFGDVVTFYNPPNGGNTELIFYSLDTVYQGPYIGLQGWGIAWADVTAPDFNNALANPYDPTGLYPPQQLNEYFVAYDPAIPLATGGYNYFVYIDSQRFAYQFYSDIPEPSTFGLLALGALGLLWRKRS